MGKKSPGQDRGINLEDRILGIFLGAACGDSLGMPVEGMSEEEIENEWGFITDLEDGPDLERGSITEDTQLLLLTAESLIAKKRVDFKDMAERLVRWSDEAIHPGTTSLTAARRLQEGVDYHSSGQDSAGIGGVTRSIPVLLYYLSENSEKALQDLATSIKITHGDEKAVGAGKILHAVMRELTGKTKFDIKNFCKKVSEAGEKENPELAEAIANLPNILELDIEEAIMYTGNTAYANEALTASMLLFLKSPGDFERSVQAAVNVGGDPDVLGFLTGAISGAYNGISSIPERWLKGLRDGERITRIAKEFAVLVREKNA